jgi:predicted nucleic acid-binding protein
MTDEQDVLIDTSAWLEFFSNGDGPVAYAVYRLVREDKAVVAGPVYAELLEAANGPQQKETLRRNLCPLRFIHDDRRDWELAGILLAKLRQRGIRAPVVTSLLSVLCIRHNLAILTLDKNFAHFEHMQWYTVK